MPFLNIFFKYNKTLTIFFKKIFLKSLLVFFFFFEGVLLHKQNLKIIYF